MLSFWEEQRDRCVCAVGVKADIIQAQLQGLSNYLLSMASYLRVRAIPVRTDI